MRVLVSAATPAPWLRLVEQAGYTGIAAPLRGIVPPAPVSCCLVIVSSGALLSVCRTWLHALPAPTALITADLRPAQRLCARLPHLRLICHPSRAIHALGDIFTMTESLWSVVSVAERPGVQRRAGRETLSGSVQVGAQDARQQRPDPARPLQPPIRHAVRRYERNSMGEFLSKAWLGGAHGLCPSPPHAPPTPARHGPARQAIPGTRGHGTGRPAGPCRGRARHGTGLPTTSRGLARLVDSRGLARLRHDGRRTGPTGPLRDDHESVRPQPCPRPPNSVFGSPA
jgi:hypothetical protein